MWKFTKKLFRFTNLLYQCLFFVIFLVFLGGLVALWQEK